MDENNKKIDEILHLLGNEISEARFNEMQDSNNKKENIHNITKIKKQRFSSKPIVKACILLLCIFIGVTAFATTTSEAFRMELFGFFFKKNDGYTDIVPSDKINIMYPSYLPEGYQKTSEDKLGTSTILNYQNTKTNDFITISQEFENNFQESVDNETTKSEKCLVGTDEAYFFYSENDSDKKIYTLMWEKNDIFIEITSTLNKNQMVKIGNSLKYYEKTQ